jgi:hypothetical protein
LDTRLLEREEGRERERGEKREEQLHVAEIATK